MLRQMLTLSPFWLLPCLAQVVVIDGRGPRIPMPQPVPIRADFRIRSVDVRADVQDQAAKVRVSQVFQNPSRTPVEAQVLFPLPEGAAVSGLTLLADGKEMTGRLMTKEEARRIYEDIVRRPGATRAARIPWAATCSRPACSPFLPRGESTVEIRYSQLLKKDSGLIDFLLPLGTTKHSAKRWRASR